VRTIRAFLVTVLIAPALVVIGASSALACSCVPPRSDPKALREAAAVFSGTVVDRSDGEVGFDEITWTFAVDTVYKGDVLDTQDIETQTQGSACGVVFEERKRYVVFAHEDTEALSPGVDLATNSCMNTRELNDGDRLTLDPVAFPDAGSDPEPLLPTKTILYGGVGVVLLTGLAYWLVRTNRGS